MESNGAPIVGTASMTLQNPPFREKFPPLILPASGWPMVPLTVKVAPVLVPLPLSIVNQSMAKFCPCAALTNKSIKQNTAIAREVLDLKLQTERVRRRDGFFGASGLYEKWIKVFGSIMFLEVWLWSLKY
jgi:hypothetical protein